MKFKMNKSGFEKILFFIIVFFLLFGCGDKTNTKISISETKWLISGKPAYSGTAAEGLLMNLRVVNSTFEDRKNPEFDPDQNTSEFIKKLPEYVQMGMRAFTLNLQGGMPGYEGAINSAFNPDGSLRSDYLNRIEQVINACDRLGAAVILGCFYQRQDQFLEDESAVRTAVVNTVKWIKEKKFTNVVLEIANEYPHRGFGHPLIRESKGIAELIELARKNHPELLVSASGMGNGKMDQLVAEKSDFILIHFNGTAVAEIPRRVAALKKFNKPIICNEDDKINEKAVAAMRASVLSGCSWGYMNSEVNQYQPFKFSGSADDSILYHALQQITTEKR